MLLFKQVAAGTKLLSEWFVLKYMSWHWTNSAEKPKFCRSAHLCGKTTNSAARLEVLQVVKTVVDNYYSGCQTSSTSVTSMVTYFIMSMVTYTLLSVTLISTLLIIISVIVNAVFWCLPEYPAAACWFSQNIRSSHHLHGAEQPALRCIIQSWCSILSGTFSPGSCLFSLKGWSQNLNPTSDNQLSTEITSLLFNTCLNCKLIIWYDRCC